MRDRPNAPMITKLILGATLLFLYAPLFSILIYSFGLPSHFGLNHYIEAFADTSLREALFQSLKVAVASTLLSTVLSTLGAIGLEKLTPSKKRSIEPWILLPLAVPEIILGISLLIWFVKMGFTLGTFTLILAHSSFTLGFVLLTVRAQCAMLDPSLEEAGRDLGASEVQIFFKITFPQLLTGIAAGALLSFALSFDDFLVSFFTTGAGSDPLPLKLYTMSRLGISGTLHAMSSSLLFLSIFCTMGLLWAMRKKA